MANTENKKNTDSNAKKVTIFTKAGGWLKRSWSEFKKVSWPTFPDVLKKTGAVLVLVAAFGLVTFGIDTGLSALMQLIIGG